MNGTWIKLENNKNVVVFVHGILSKSGTSRTMGQNDFNNDVRGCNCNAHIIL